MRKKTKLIIFSALLAAIIAVCTRFTGQIPIPGTTSGYVHVGDSFVFLAAAFLPTPYAMCAAAIGGALADIMYGSMIYVIPTAIIKALMALMFFGKKTKKLISVKNIISAVLGILVLVAGYYVAEVIIYSSFITPLIGMVWNAAQGIFSAITFVIIGLALDAAKVRERLEI